MSAFPMYEQANEAARQPSRSLYTLAVKIIKFKNTSRSLYTLVVIRKNQC